MGQMLGVLIALFAGLPFEASAADFAIPLRKVFVKTEPEARTRRALFKSVGSEVTLPAADPSSVGARLQLTVLDCSGGLCAPLSDTGDISLPAEGWSARGRPPGTRGYRYRDPQGSAGGVRAVVVKPGRIAVKAVGASWPLAPDGGGNRLAVQLRIGDDRYCAGADFVGAVSEEGLLRLVDVAAPPQCDGFCGNGSVDAGEGCDSPDDSSCTGLCQSDCSCPTPVCGNGVWEDGEECDTGSGPPGYGCTQSCELCALTAGCDSLPCCAAGVYCMLVPGDGLCQPFAEIGDPCGRAGSTEILCNFSLACCEPGTSTCDSGSGDFSGECCGLLDAGCMSDGDCCISGVPGAELACVSGLCTLVTVP